MGQSGCHGDDARNAIREPTLQKNVALRVSQELCKCQCIVNIDSFNAVFIWTSILDPLLKRMTNLLENTSNVDNVEGAGTSSKDLKKALPSKLTKPQTLEAPMVDIDVQVWVILDDFIASKVDMLRSNVEGELGLYITTLIDHTLSSCNAALRDEMQITIEMMTLKMPVQEEICGYLTDRGTKLKSHLCICPRCEALYMHETPPNKGICARNKARFGEYTRLNEEHHDDYNTGCCIDPPVDGKGNRTKNPCIEIGHQDSCRPQSCKSTSGPLDAQAYSS